MNIFKIELSSGRFIDIESDLSLQEVCDQIETSSFMSEDKGRTILCKHIVSVELQRTKM
jgi:hypothetical protein